MPDQLPQAGDEYRSVDKVFTVIAVGVWNDIPDLWIKYKNDQNLEFSCSLNAFLSRFNKQQKKST
jgi:hypothetical protein